mmetsp:Transcript_6195/g.9345  ORF Transcript_6195/g.9345 Transcript_6195/m.9345 type:complete len:207 (+) Transcript_6195:119-739(+)|eukprot:CAMPEP_0185031086 /NCGR_PEP_ID=MMETSP1103-20130426/18361_1 /TAXON_ID=36769 /ORGANISM="Paraphysomonas bandaiensis, Strain Caron Lab Isolate" /LENGTH=206 /DNA_ID=CAMNT_0027566473 /DNA_START=49 /DNA_END=669 /DNA_ORIENTATION=-
MGACGLPGNSLDAHGSEAIALMMPAYYMPTADVGPNDIAAAKVSWSLITDDKAQPFLFGKKERLFQYSTCIGWFYVVFFERLFDVHPACKPLFTAGVISQGKFLVKMITLSLHQLDEQEAFINTMHTLAVRHCERGVRAVEFGIVGDVLFYTLRKVLGDDYTDEVDIVWKKIYSGMLRIIVPLVIAYEMSGSASVSDDPDSKVEAS